MSTTRWKEKKAFVITRPRTVAAALMKENAVTNGGRGSSVVAGMIHLLRRDGPGDVESAQRIWDTDRDKVRQYPKLYDLCAKSGFGG